MGYTIIFSSQPLASKENIIVYITRVINNTYLGGLNSVYIISINNIILQRYGTLSKSLRHTESIYFIYHVPSRTVKDELKCHLFFGNWHK